ncbi:transglycosylase domain-containing protein, partial [Actinomyces sp. 187325]|nr:penicillin-binding protein [Actinomyces sp. 187325]
MADTSASSGGRPTGRRLADAARSSSKGTSRTGRSGRATRRRPARSAPARSRAAAKGRPTGRRRLINYPRAGKGPVMRWLPGWRFLLGSFLLLVAALATTFIVAYSVIKVPEPSEFAQAQSTTVYYADGATEMGTFAEVDRTIIDTTTLPEHVGNAVVASEDRTFWTNSGVDPKGIIRALWNNLRGGATQGASTLTQQYIKNYYVDTTSSYAGKFQQAIMAIKIDRELPKEQILGSYLNTVYFGRGAYGIEAASQAFYGHPASELTVAESALLAGILPAPSAWDPAIDPEQAAARFERVLDLMLEDGHITQAERDAAVMPETIANDAEEVYGGPNGYLLQMVRAELQADAGLSAEQIDTGGYTIVTTINKTDQDAAVAAVNNLPEGHSENLRVALVSVDSATGGILALYGGSDYLTNQVNAATDAVAQAGSTFKPFALVAALENGATLVNGYSGASPMEIDGNTFRNYGDVSYSWSDLIKMTAFSINTSYVQLNRDLGAEVTNEVAVRAGYPKDTIGLDAYAQNVLGSASPHTIDIATAFATFSAQGVRHDTHIVASVTNSAGSVAYQPSTDGEQVFDTGVMADATYAMQKVVEYGSGTTALELDRPVAAKTGSSSDNKSAQFVGYTPQVTTAVTLYQTGADGSEESITPWGEYDEITGSTYPADIFTDYMATALADLPVVDFPDRTEGSYYRGGLYGTAQPIEEATTQVPTEEPTEAPTTETPAEPQQPTQPA